MRSSLPAVLSAVASAKAEARRTTAGLAGLRSPWRSRPDTALDCSSDSALPVARFERVDIGEILQAAGGTLVPQKRHR
jgi:hypothetical protein